ncbi:response regulator [Halorubrum sp. F4]|uniref:response regulator n=1 Tax=Halorubrum sp. F4 TaxID=2989715 RepID=UPI002480D986|nr:response regulator [Halorubrum sp. F4]
MTGEPHANATGTAPRTTRTRSEDTPPVEAEVLHVEPDTRSTEVFSAFLERFAEGITVRSVDRVSTAAAVIDDVDCVVTEQRLPDGTGIELLERARKRGSRTPFLFHTTCHDPVVEARAFEADAAGYVHKRSERGQYDRLLTAVRNALGRVGDVAGPVSEPAADPFPSGSPNASSTPLRSEE